MGAVGSVSYLVENNINSVNRTESFLRLKIEARDAAEKKEKQVLDYIMESLNKLLQELEKANSQKIGGRPLRIDVLEMRRKQDALKEKAAGFIGAYMDGKVTLDSPEISKILEEMDDRKRKRKFDDFQEKLLKEAVKQLMLVIEPDIHKQEESIRQEVQNRLTEVELDVQAATDSYVESLLLLEELGEAGTGEEQIQYRYQYDLAKILLRQIR